MVDMTTLTHSGDTSMSDEFIIVWVWSIHHPKYSERITAMSQAHNVRNAFYEAGFLSLVPKE